MKIFILFLILIFTTTIVVASAQRSSHLDTNWTILFTVDDQIAYGFDKKSFNVISQRDKFTYDKIIIFRRGVLNIQNNKILAIVAKVEISCKAKTEQIIQDILINFDGIEIFKNQLSEIDTPVSPQNESISWHIMNTICVGELPNKQNNSLRST